MPWLLDLFSVVIGTEDQFKSEATVKKTSLRGFWSTYDVLPVNTVEGRWMQKRMQNSLSNIY